jgi:peptide/nickel transport system permease protein
VLVLASIVLGAAILIEASLGVLGLGVPPPAPSWGNMLSGAGRQFFVQAPWIAIAPGIAIGLLVLSFNLLGDAIRDAIDPKLRGR